MVSADNFSIVAGGVAVQGTEGSPGLADIERGRSRDRGKEGKENSRSSGRQRETLGARGGATARTTDASAPANNSPAGKSRTRTFSASPAGGTYYIYSFDGRLLAEYNLYGTCVRDYIYFGGQLIAEFDTVGSQIYYYTSDQISSTRIVTNSTGVVVYAAAHDPYGGIQQTWPGNTFNPTPKFSGKERDGESDLDYFGARYYDKSQYRFISVDPIINSNAFYKSPQRMNLYGYCVNSPLSFMDIDGRVIVPVALPGSGGATLHTYLDSFFIGTVGLFIDWCASWGISLEFNNAFRTQEEQDRIRKKNPIAAKISLHSAGWAFDIEKEYWESLTELEQSIVTSIAFLLGMESGAQFNDPNHFYADPWGIDTKGLEARKVAIQDACKLLSYYEYGVAGLSSLELYLIYGVFTEAAAWNVILKAEIDLTSRH